MKYLIAIGSLLAALAWPVAAYSQCSGQFQPGGVCSNPNGAQQPPVSSPLAAVIDRNFGAPSAQGTVLNRGGSAWTATANPVLGLPGTTTGSLGLASVGGGTLTIGVPSISGAVNFKLPGSNGTSGFVLSTDGSGNTSWVNNAAGGTVQSVGLALPTSVFSISGSPVTTTGTLTGAFISQTANQAFLSPNGSSGVPTFRSLVGADLPNPTTSSLGGIQAINAVASNWIRSINTSGVPQLSQPAFSDISGSITPAQCPFPTTSAIGCVQAINAVTSNWISSINGSGVPQLSQPAFSDISGSLAAAQLPVIANNSVLANISGGSTFPTPTTTTALIDATIGNTQGNVLYRNATGWVVLAPGTMGQVLSSGGPAANVTWTTVTGTGTVTSIATNNGITGGTITSSGTIGLATIATGNVLAYTGGGTGVPVATAPTSILDVIGSTQGDILFRGASTWGVLTPGTNGQVLQTLGPGAGVQWANAGTVSSVGLAAGTAASLTGTCTITTSGTCTVNARLFCQLVLTSSQTVTWSSACGFTPSEFFVEEWSGGASGAGENGGTSSGRGAGGGGGAYAWWHYSGTADTTLAVTIGAGGASCTSSCGGNPGGTTSVVGSNFGTLSVAGGFGPGCSGGNCPGGAGGAAGTSPGSGTGFFIAGGGGGAQPGLANVFGIGGNAPRGGPGGYTNVAIAGTIPGGGGSGENHTGGGSGAGARGEVHIYAR